MFNGESTSLLDAYPGSQRHDGPVVMDWNNLAEPLQLMLASAALRRAAATVAFQAEVLAREMECGSLQDGGGPDALRLLAALIRVTNQRNSA
jgi:hypothetical protein